MILGGAVILALIFLGWLWYSKGKSGLETINTKSRCSEEKFLHSDDPELREIAEAAYKGPPPLSSLDKVEQAFDRKEIDVNKMVKLKLLAFFVPQLLSAIPLIKQFSDHHPPSQGILIDIGSVQINIGWDYTYDCDLKNDKRNQGRHYQN